MPIPLAEWTAKVAGFVDLTKRGVVNATVGVVEVPDMPGRRGAREQLAAVRGRRSRGCQLANNVSLAAIEKDLLAGAEEAEPQAKLYYEQHVDAVMKGFVKMVDSYPQGGL